MPLQNPSNNEFRQLTVSKRVAAFVSKNDFPFPKKEAKKRMCERFEAKWIEAKNKGEDFEPTADNLNLVYKDMRNSVSWRKSA